MDFNAGRFVQELVTEMADAVIYADGAGKILFWNKGATRIFGFSEAEALGQSLDIIIPQNLRQRHWHGYNETMRTGKSRYAAGALLAVPALHKDGSRVSIEFTVVPFHDAAGKMAGIAAILRDVTERWNETKALKERVAALEAAQPA